MIKYIFENVIRHIRSGTILWRIKNHRKIEKERSWINFYYSDKAFVDKRVFNQLKLRLYKNSLLTKSIFFDEFEVTEISFISRYVNEGDVFFDIGANIGLFSIIASGLVKGQGLVYSFEPSKDNFSKLQENVVLNELSNIKLNNIGLSDRNETKLLYNYADGNGALTSFSMPPKDSNFYISKSEVQTLDSFIQKNSIGAIDWIKIDVEGWELPVFKGGEKIFSDRDAPGLIVEFTDSNARQAGFSCQELFDILIQYGYLLYTYDATLNKLKLEEKKDFYTYSNIIALKKNSNVANRTKINT